MRFNLEYQNSTAAVFASGFIQSTFPQASDISVFLLCLAKALDQTSDHPRFSLNASHIAGMAENAATSTFAMPGSALVSSETPMPFGVPVKVQADTRDVSLPSGSIKWDNLRPWMRTCASIASSNDIQPIEPNFIQFTLDLLAVALAESSLGCSLDDIKLFYTHVQNIVALNLPLDMQHLATLNPYQAMARGLIWVDYSVSSGQIQTTISHQEICDIVPGAVLESASAIVQRILAIPAYLRTDLDTFLKTSLGHQPEVHFGATSGHDLMEIMEVFDCVLEHAARLLDHVGAMQPRRQLGRGNNSAPRRPIGAIGQCFMPSNY